MQKRFLCALNRGDWVNLVIILLMVSAFLLTRVTNMRLAVWILSAQSLVVAAASLVKGFETGQLHYFFAALMTAVIKAGIIPYALFRILGRLKRERETVTALTANRSSLAALAATAVAYSFIDRTMLGVISRDAVAASIALALIGLLIIMLRHQAVLQIIGLNTMENGLYLLGLSLADGLPLIIELGIFFDALVAVGILGLLTYRLKLSYSSTDTSLLERLRG